MEPIHGPAAADADPIVEIGELILLNGRQSGSRKPLAGSLTLIGRAPTCEVRLNVEGVQPLHCALVHTVEGTTLRDLGGVGHTLVNGEPAVSQPLEDEDVLTIGPFHFRLRLKVDGRSAVRHVHRELDQLQKEKDALRIQAAAVVAQQAVLSETESRLDQRRLELTRQEEQLAAHLEEKRGRLLELQTQVRQEREALQTERAALTQRENEVEEELTTGRKELAQGRFDVETRRRRMSELRKRLKVRWHKMFDRERQSLRRREQEVAARHRELDTALATLQQERAAFVRQQLRQNGEIELNRRQLQAGWDDLQQARRNWNETRAKEQCDLQQRRFDVARREAAVLRCEKGLAEEQREWEERRAHLEREAEGLNNRIRNARRKIVDQQQELSRLNGFRSGVGQEVVLTSPTASDVRLLAAPDLTVEDTHAVVQARVPSTVVPLEEGLTELERLADVVAGQKLHLTDQCRRLQLLQERWSEDHRSVVEELEVVGSRLAQREQDLDAREHGLDIVTATVKQRFDQAVQQRQLLEGWHARLAAREAAWEAERERTLTAVQAREEAAAEQLTLLTNLRQRWSEERSREAREVETDHERCQAFRDQYVKLWEECFRKTAALEQHQKTLAEKALALEQYRLEVIGQSENSAVAERRMEKLRSQLAALSAVSERRLSEEREKLRVEASRLHDLSRRLQRQAGELARREEELERRLEDWDHEQGLAELTQSKLRQELQTLQAHRDSYERQITALNQELERLARTLLDESETPPVLLERAA